MTSLTLVRRIKAQPSAVFDALTTPKAILCWWSADQGPVLAAEVDLRISGRFRVRFRMLDGSEHEAGGEYVEITRPTRLALTWRWKDGEDPGESLLSFDLRAIAEGTELTLTHALLHEQSVQSHEEGWNGALDNLERHLFAQRAPGDIAG